MHSTQRPVIVLHSALPSHWLLLVQPVHSWATALHRDAAPLVHCTSFKQPTQTLVSRLQMGRSAAVGLAWHWASSRHSTHVCDSGSQTRPLPAHCPSSRHCTHWLLSVSHRRSSPLVHVLLSVHS